MFGTNRLAKKRHDQNGDVLSIQSIFSTIQGEGPYAGVPAIFLRLAGCNLRCTFCDTDFESKATEMTKFDVIRKIRNLSMERNTFPTKLVVITGGEPLLQNLIPLIYELTHLEAFEVQIETAGSVWLPGLETFVKSEDVTIVCSPKTGKVAEEIEEYCFNWKYLIQEGAVSEKDGLPNKSTQVPGKELELFRPPRANDIVWLQPCEAYKVDYKQVMFQKGQPPEGIDVIDVMPDGEHLLADQEITSAVRDEWQSQRNVTLCGELAMRYNYRVSLQLHKYLKLP